MSILAVGFGSGGEGGGGPPPAYEIDKSLRFRASASAYLSRTPGSASNRTTWTWSGWVKRGLLSSSDYHPLFSANDVPGEWTTLGVSNDSLYLANTVGAANAGEKRTTAVFRDPSAWYHVVAVWDTTNATAANRMRLYVNGVEYTAFNLSTNPALNQNSYVNAATVHRISYFATNAVYADHYLSEINFIDGQALTPADFGETDSNGVWVAKEYTGTYGTNGFYLPFNDGTNLTELTKDRSGNANNWTATNVSLTAGATYDWMNDTPTNGFPTLSSLSRFSTGGTLSAANLAASHAINSGNNKPTFAPTSGKWYAEFRITALSGTDQAIALAATTADGLAAKDRMVYASNGQKFDYNASAYNSYGSAWAVNDVIAVAWDIDAKQVTFYKNNVSQGTLSAPVVGTGSGDTVSYTITNSSGTNTVSYAVNFGQRPFTYTPPTGFLALCTKNLPAPSIENPRQYFDVKTYTGNGSSLAVTGIAFQPDFLWLKNRGTTTSHVLQDVQRGAGKSLFSNATSAEAGNTGDLITSFNSDGLTVNDTYLGGSGGGGTNGTSGNYVAWLWKANGAGVTNTAGTITSTVSANTTAGFSVVTYTGTGANATVGHGLGRVPGMVIVKRRNGTGVWAVFGNGQFIRLAFDTGAERGNLGLTLTSTTFSFNTVDPGNASWNANGSTYVTYCFAEIPGFSRIGSYTGNGSADGPFVYCGFRPRWVMVKASTVAGRWIIWDAQRSTTNVVSAVLDASSAEDESIVSGADVDFTSNGFKIRRTSSNFNTNAATHIFLAFAEHPFNSARAR
jgi:hypothetical protein